jgi:hypothetical protein
MARGSKRGEWNSYLTDADQYKLSKKEILERKKLFISKNNAILIAPSAPILNKQKERVHKKKSEICTKETNASISSHRRSISQSPFTINSSSVGTTQSADSDDENGSNPYTESDESILNRDDAKDLSSLDLLEQSCDHSYDQTVSQQLFQERVPAFGKINRTMSKTTKKKKSVQIMGKVSSLVDCRITSGYSKQIPLLELSHTSVKEPESVDNDGKYLIEMVHEIQTLRTELRYYEQLSGRKSILNGEVCAILFSVLLHF